MDELMKEESEEDAVGEESMIVSATFRNRKSAHPMMYPPKKYPSRPPIN
jgi:hypothetical protein